MHLFTIFIALHKSYCVGGVQVQQQPKHYLIVYIYIYVQVEYKCSSSPSNPGATLKWETHDAHDGTKSSTAILVLFCFLFAH